MCIRDRVEDDLRGDAGVRAAEHRGEGGLAGRELLAQLDALVRVVTRTVDEAVVAGDEFSPRVVRGPRPGVSSSGRHRDVERSVDLGEQARVDVVDEPTDCLLYTSPSPRDRTRSRMPSSA